MSMPGRAARSMRGPRAIVASTIYIIHPSSEKRRDLAAMVANGADDVRTLESAEEFLQTVASNACGCVVASSDLDGMGMRALLAAIRERHLRLPVIVLGHGADLAMAVDLVRAGAAEFLEPPVSDRRLRSVVRQAIAWSGS